MYCLLFIGLLARAGAISSCATLECKREEGLLLLQTDFKVRRAASPLMDKTGDTLEAAKDSASRKRVLHLSMRTRKHPPPLRVYVYDGPDWLKTCDLSRKDQSGAQDLVPDIAMHSALKRHQWRTMNASEADLFFVPAYISLSVMGHCGNHTRNLLSLARYLYSFPHFRRTEGKDHLLSSFSWMACEGLERLDWELYDWPRDEGCKDTLRKYPFVKNMIVARNEAWDLPTSGQRATVVPYAPQAPAFSESKMPSFEERKHSLFLVGQADCRKDYIERRVAMKKLPTAFPDSVLICINKTNEQGTTAALPESCDGIEQFNPAYPAELAMPLPVCGSLLPPQGVNGCLTNDHLDSDKFVEYSVNSKYNLMIHGDTPSSSRLYDAIHFGSIPIIISASFRERAMPFPDELPWEDFAVWIDQEAFLKNPVSEIQQALHKVRKNQTQYLERLAEVKPALDWSVGGDCMGTVLLTHIARHYFNQTNLPPGGRSSHCGKASAGMQLAPWVGSGSRGHNAE